MATFIIGITASIEIDSSEIKFINLDIPKEIDGNEYKALSQKDRQGYRLKSVAECMQVGDYDIDSLDISII